MAGTKMGGEKSARTNKAKYGKDFYAEIGRKGGSKGSADGVIKGFALNKQRAIDAGRKGGTISKRGKKENK